MNNAECTVFKRYYKVTDTVCGAGYIETEENFGNVLDMLKECSNGDGYTITVVHMSQEAYEALPEFAGF